MPTRNNSEINTLLVGLYGEYSDNHIDSPVPLKNACKRLIITSDLWHCLSDEAHCCPSAASFGYGYYCKHQERK